MANPIPTFYVAIDNHQYGFCLHTSNYRSEGISSINGEDLLTITYSKDMLRRSVITSGMHSQVLDSTFGRATSSYEEDSSSSSCTSSKLEASTNDETNTASISRTARVQSSKRKLYDMTFEQIDPVTRFNPKRRRPGKVSNVERSAPKGCSRKLRSSASGKDVAFRECSKGTRQSRRMDIDLFAEPIQEDWKQLNALDRRVYRLQHGSPIKGDAIPLKWSTVIKTLIRERFFSREQCIMWGGEEALKKRYETVRKAMQVFFGGAGHKEEPSSRKNWTILTMEGWEVFDIGFSAIISKSQSSIENYDGSQDLDVAGEEYDGEFHDTVECPMGQILDGSSNEHYMIAREAHEELGSEDALSHFITHTSRVDVSRIIGEPLMTEEEVEKAYEDHLSQEHTADNLQSDTLTSSDISPQATTQPEVNCIAPSAPHFNIYENPKSQSTKATATILSDPSSATMDTAKSHQGSDEDDDIEEARKLLFSQFKAKNHTTQTKEKAILSRTSTGAEFGNTFDTFDT